MKNISEEIFECFCAEHNIAFERIPEGPTPTPDYFIEYKSERLIVEIKQIDKAFKDDCAVTIGKDVRNVIQKAKGQIKKYYEIYKLPACIIIYNNSDPRQISGTSYQDFIIAMNGDMTCRYNLKTMEIIDTCLGQHKSVHKDKNRSISAVGHIVSNYDQNQKRVFLYQNAYAHLKVPIVYDEVFVWPEIVAENKDGITEWVQNNSRKKWLSSGCS